jgi:hypothetical protein
LSIVYLALRPLFIQNFFKSGDFLEENLLNKRLEQRHELELFINPVHTLQKLFPKLVNVLRSDKLVEFVSKAVLLVERHERSQQAN